MDIFQFFMASSVQISTLCFKKSLFFFEDTAIFFLLPKMASKGLDEIGQNLNNPCSSNKHRIDKYSTNILATFAFFHNKEDG